MTEIHTLANGMKVVLEENQSAPVVSFHILVNVGSALEKPNEAGICHVIEHMLFKGTPSRRVGEIARDVETAGGEINAYTSFDQTVFYINMASRFTKKGLGILADAVQNPLFDKVELEREKEVILEEIRRDLDNPSRQVNEILFTKAFRRHTYKNPIIGNTKTVKSFTRKQLFDFYRKWYTPANMALVVVGSFKSKEMLKSISTTFKRFRGKRPKDAKLPLEPMFKGLNFHLKENPVQATYFSIGFNIPELVHDDIPKLDILAHILAGTDSSRLEQVVKEDKQLVNAIHSYAFTPKYPGLFIIGGITTPQKTNAAISAICDEIQKLHKVPIRNGELVRAKLNIKSSEIYEKETTSGQASKYTYFLATAGNYEFEKKYYQQLSDVTAEDIRTITQKYLTPKNATFVIINPKKMKRLTNIGKIKKHIRNPSKQLISKTAKGVAEPVVHKLDNGIRLVIQENHILPIVSCCAVTNGGLRFETSKNNGINNLIARTTTKGTLDKNAIQIAEKIESVAGAIEGFSGRNSAGLKTEFLSDKFTDGFDLFLEILAKPSFAGDEVKKEKAQVLEAIKNQEDALASLTFMKFAEALFPDHPYGLRYLGTKETVKNMTKNSLSDYYWKIMNPKNLVISICGDIAPDEVISMANKRLIFPSGKLGGFKTPHPQRPPAKPVTIEYMRPEKEQAHIIMGFLGPMMNSKDRYAIAVLNNIMAGQGGRLFLNLRDKMSLAYAVSSTFFVGIEPGFIAVYIGTEPSKVNTAIAGITKELESLIKHGVTAEELTRSKNYIIGTHEMEHQRTSSLASAYAFNVLYNIGLKEVEAYPKRISKVTRDDILKAAQKYIDIKVPVTAIVRPK